jgi:hypothetical protein
MDAFGITIIRVARGTRLDHSNLVPLPGDYLVDALMAVFALNVVDEMGACIMFRPFLFVTSMTRHRFRMDFRPFGLGMNFDICDIVVATVAGVGSMNGLGKFPLADFRVAAQTFRIVNTLVAIFPALDSDLLPLLGRWGGWGRLCRLDTLLSGDRGCYPCHPRAPKERDGKDETKKDRFLKFGFHGPPNERVD